MARLLFCALAWERMGRENRTTVLRKNFGFTVFWFLMLNEFWRHDPHHLFVHLRYDFLELSLWRFYPSDYGAMAPPLFKCGRGWWGVLRGSRSLCHFWHNYKLVGLFWRMASTILCLRSALRPLWIWINPFKCAKAPSSEFVVFGIFNSGYFWYVNRQGRFDLRLWYAERRRLCV